MSITRPYVPLSAYIRTLPTATPARLNNRPAHAPQPIAPHPVARTKLPHQSLMTVSTQIFHKPRNPTRG